ncbi:MAG: sialate O-acetylesterase [Acidobacteriaceae bacterium]|nr:sialate O-acetylesterase [Acidobacteriaceae bacterium]
MTITPSSSEERLSPFTATVWLAQQVSATFDGTTVTAAISSSGAWEVRFPVHDAGGPYVLDVSSGADHLHLQDLMVGDVWLASGQSNMHFTMRPFAPWTEGVLDYEREIAAANNPNVRFFTVPIEASFPEKTEEKGYWQVASPETACNFSAVAYYFAQKVQQQTGVPIGILSAAVGSTSVNSWIAPSRSDPAKLQHDEAVRHQHVAGMATYEASLPAYYAAAREALSSCTGAPVAPHHDPFPNFIFETAGAYNAMIAPLRSFPIKGVIWYQGEADARYSETYADKFRNLVESWRANWHNPDLPFYFVQLANRDFRAAEIMHHDFREGNFSLLRYQQFNDLSISHTGLAVATDVGDPGLIHPRNKKPVGERLALQALRKTYGLPVIADGPIFQSITVDGDKLVVHFATNGSPLVNRTGSSEPAGFEVAGSDGYFVPALAKLQGDTVVLSSPAVPQPKHARYAWGDDPRLSIYNEAGLPAPSFQTP